MIIEITNQVRFTVIQQRHKRYEILLNKKPDLIPHDGFVECEILPGCWLKIRVNDLLEKLRNKQ